MSRLLEAEELSRQLADLPGVVAGRVGTLTVALRAPSFPDAVQLAQLVGEDAEQLDHHPDIDIRWRTVTFTLSTHSAGGVTQLDIELAHRILASAIVVKAETLPAPERVEIALDCVDVDTIRPFWTAGLGYRPQRLSSGEFELHDPAGRGPVLWFQRMEPPRTERGRFHLDVYVAADQALDRVRSCLEAGGRLVSDAHAPSWWVLADPEGNELCVCTTPSP
jgi:4a-hydroxytetrahydrobiopterin dehydratase